jgi:hypothetical protein
MINLCKLQDFDILLMAGEDVLAMAIRAFEIDTEETREGHLIKGVIDGLKYSLDQNVPIHSRMVYSASMRLGCEMTWPHPRTCDLIKDEKEIIQVCRCPYLSDPAVHDDMNKWWNSFIAEKETYGIDNLLTFPTGIPVDERHLVCSQATTQALITVLNDNNIDPRMVFPNYWIDKNELLVEKVSPYDQFLQFTLMNWNITKEIS